MSFLTVLEADAKAAEQTAMADLKSFATYIDNAIVTEISPELSQAILTALEKLGETALTQLLGTAVSAL